MSNSVYGLTEYYRNKIKDARIVACTGCNAATALFPLLPIVKNRAIDLNSIIVEAQKKKIISADDLRNITKEVLNSNQKTVLLAIYNNQNQRRYIGVKLE